MSPALRPTFHPGQSETIVHFTGRARKESSPETYFLSPEGILDLILSEERLLAKPPFGSKRDTVCLSESDEFGVAALLARGQFAGWGIVLQRNWVWRVGGGPVWYARDEVWRSVNAKADQELLQWMVRTSPQEADWFHEREWRIPARDPSSYIDLDPDAVAAILVSDSEWEPSPSQATDYWGDGRLAVLETTNRLAAQVPRWFWNGDCIEILPPVPFDAHLLGFIDA